MHAVRPFAITALAVLVYSGCKKDDGSSGDTAPATEQVVTSAQPEQNDGANNGVLAPVVTIATATTADSCHGVKGFFYAGACHDAKAVCASDQKDDGTGEACKDLTITELTSRTDCLKHDGYWYDKADVAAVTADGFAALKGHSCHEAAAVGCPTSGSVAYASQANGTLISDPVNSYAVFPTAATKLYSTLRCITGLHTLYLNYSPDVDALDTTNNRSLQQIDVGSTKLTTVDTSKLADLVELSLSSTGIAKLDLSKNPKLQHLYASGTPMTTLDLSGNPALESLWMYNASLTSLDLSKQTKLNDLTYAYPHDDGLSALDLTHNPLLASLELSFNQNLSLASLALADKPLTSLAAEGLIMTSTAGLPSTLQTLGLNGALTTFSCAGFPALTRLTVFYSPLTSVNLAGCPLLTDLDLEADDLTSINLTANTLLETVVLAGNDLTYTGMAGSKLDLHTLSHLQALDVTDNAHLTLSFERGVTFHANYLDNTSAASQLYIDAAGWTRSIGADKPAWNDNDADGVYVP